jgi:hypothetical protein
MTDNNIKLNRYCKYCGTELVVKDIREPKRIGFDEFTGKDKLSHREYFGVCPNRNKLGAYPLIACNKKLLTKYSKKEQKEFHEFSLKFLKIAYPEVK